MCLSFPSAWSVARPSARESEWAISSSGGRARTYHSFAARVRSALGDFVHDVIEVPHCILQVFCFLLDGLERAVPALGISVHRDVDADQLLVVLRPVWADALEILVQCGGGVHAAAHVSEGVSHGFTGAPNDAFDDLVPIDDGGAEGAVSEHAIKGPPVRQRHLQQASSVFHIGQREREVGGGVFDEAIDFMDVVLQDGDDLIGRLGLAVVEKVDTKGDLGDDLPQRVEACGGSLLPPRRVFIAEFVELDEL